MILLPVEVSQPHSDFSDQSEPGTRPAVNTDPTLQLSLGVSIALSRDFHGLFNQDSSNSRGHSTTQSRKKKSQR